MKWIITAIDFFRALYGASKQLLWGAGFVLMVIALVAVSPFKKPRKKVFGVIANYIEPPKKKMRRGEKNK